MEVVGYNEDGSIRVEINGVVGSVPDEMSNGHRRIIAEWEALGNTIPAYEPPPPPPLAPLTRRRLRLGLLANGIASADVEAAIASIIDPTERAVAEIEWTDASSYERDHPLIAQVGGAIGLSDEQIDTMWAHALSL
jgi:hypothetical protein